MSPHPNTPSCRISGVHARILSLLLLLAFQPALSANPETKSTPAVKAEIVSTVDSQLQAFREGDFAKAYSFAAIDIRNQFPLERFEQMVRQGYPAIAKSRKADFGLCFDDGDQAVLNVTIEGADGTRKEFQYKLVKEQKGWRIQGVQDLGTRGIST